MLKIRCFPRICLSGKRLMIYSLDPHYIGSGLGKVKCDRAKVQNDFSQIKIDNNFISIIP
jgi:hypothetical protein